MASSSKLNAVDAKDCTTVQIEGLALLKIVNHCQSSLPQPVSGQLLGLDVGQQLEVTACFPFSMHGAEDEDVERDRDYQYEMLRSLREVNVDSNPVGWYCSVWQEDYLSTDVIEHHFDWQKALGNNGICLIFNPLKTTHGKLWIKALRLQDKFMQMYSAGDFTQECIKENRLTHDDIFQELPVTIHNNVLIDVFIKELSTSKELNDPSTLEDTLELETTGYICHGLNCLADGVDDLQQSLQKYMYDHRKWKTSEGFKDAGSKAAQKPSRLDSMLLSKQMMNHCTYLEDFGLRNFEALYFADTIQKVTEGPRDMP